MPDKMRVKNRVDFNRPWLWLHEEEPDANGVLQGVNTVFLTGSECPFKCTMCDLWKNTLDNPTPAGAIPRQLQYALRRLPDASVIKLYNSGNFFDRRAIPPEDYQQICLLSESYNRVIVENHPLLCNETVPVFRDMLRGSLEVAMGLETIHPEALSALDKQMTKEQFAESTHFLISNDIPVRAFVLLNPPCITRPEENSEWAVKTVQFAFEHGVECCSIIPTRPGTDAMETFQNRGVYVPPTIEALESVFEKALALRAGRIFTDLWDLERFSGCATCFEKRKERLHRMNLMQKILPAIICSCNSD